MASVAVVRPVAARSHEPDCPLLHLLPQARDCARKLEALKPLFVEPRSKGSFSEVRVRWGSTAPRVPGWPGLVVRGCGPPGKLGHRHGGSRRLGGKALSPALFSGKLSSPGCWVQVNLGTQP